MTESDSHFNGTTLAGCVDNRRRGGEREARVEAGGTS